MYDLEPFGSMSMKCQSIYVATQITPEFHNSIFRIKLNFKF